MATHPGIDSISATHVRVCELASGGMGRVDLTIRKQGEFRRLYAVKRLHTHFRDDPDLRAMFLDEARVAGLLQHPNVVSVLDVGEDEEGPLLVMEYVDGLSLSKLLSLCNQHEEPLPVQACLRIAIDISKGLHAAHELVDHEGKLLQLVHRDLSPQNVLIDWNGNVRLTDFGIAKAMGQSSKTATGVVKGKLSYLSPEQLRYEDIDRRSDLFALGILLFEMLAGRRLYKNVEGKNALQRILHEPPPDIGEDRPDVPPVVVDLIFQLLSKTAAERPETAKDVQRVLESALADLRQAEPVLELGSVLDEVAGDLRAQKSAELGVAIDAASRASKGGQRTRQVGWKVVGAVVALVLCVVAAWQLGRASAGGDESEPTESLSPISPVSPITAEVAPVVREPDERAERDPEPEIQPDEIPAEQSEVVPPAAMSASRPRMRVRMNARMTMRANDTSVAAMDDRWDDWE